ncbi:hypothetical protein X560_0060 [Listeria fleischmannii 1991]|uniref:Predicted membrane protein n=2 Tax=Listeria fleischmannii TaxID=1069827 RepID=A0A2X3GRV6_9LIST|nr:DUF1634 domain-containing protein [Listeria fleischmannii]EMG27958.1 hypothetical protein LFLEISCH_08222 [Listeria fleischmannii subsp. fleischmannii LU2006-1]KMT61352.1 hypothetical protein X560_0060 [Listeria fleischmannii 1991]SQC63121.1 Predicted membrane protein [Listeria fleischmannii subsp. fleischmannii]
MTQDKQKEEEMYQVELIVGGLLRIGVLLSAGIIVLGLALYLFTGESGYSGATYPTSFSTIFSGLVDLKPFAIIMFGLLCLIFTPVFRVVVSLFTFLKEKDYLYVGITGIVLFILLISFLIGKG